MIRNKKFRIIKNKGEENYSGIWYILLMNKNFIYRGIQDTINNKVWITCEIYNPYARKI